jgi:hypothetical protein
MEVSGRLHAPAASSPGKIRRYPLDGRLRGAENRSGYYGEKKMSYPTRNRAPTVCPAAIPTEPSRLSYVQLLHMNTFNNIIADFEF